MGRKGFFLPNFLSRAQVNLLTSLPGTYKSCYLQILSDIPTILDKTIEIMSSNLDLPWISFTVILNSSPYSTLLCLVNYFAGVRDQQWDNIEQGGCQGVVLWAPKLGYCNLFLPFRDLSQQVLSKTVVLALNKTSLFYVIATMLLFLNKKALVIFICLLHQSSHYALYYLKLWGLSEKAR